MFAGTAEEVTVLAAACSVALSKRDVGWALQRLRGIKPAAPAFRAARAAIAEISLTHRKDRRAFAAAHLDVVSTYGDFAAHVQCGDAFMRLQVRRF